MNYNKKTEERGGCLNTGYHKRVHPFRNFLVVLPPPPYIQFKLGKKKLWKHASNVVCGVRGGALGYVWIGKRPRNSKVSQDFYPWLQCAFILLTMLSFCVKNQWIGTRTVINSHWEPPLPNAPRLGWIMGRGEPGGGKERGIRRQSVPSLRGGGWGDKLGVWCPFSRKEE